jgi:beta-N-acetylhexosaminidase
MKSGMRDSFVRCAALMLCLSLTMPRIARGQGVDEDVEALLARMSPMERVGQLFVVGFPGSSVSQESAILDLIQRYRIGGVVLTGGNQSLGSSEVGAEALHDLIAVLQSAALSPEIPITATPTAQASGEANASTVTASPSPQATVGASLSPQATAEVNATATASPSPQATAEAGGSASPTPETAAEATASTATVSPPVVGTTPGARSSSEVPIPLFVAIAPEAMQWMAGQTAPDPNLSMMALGATWDAELAQKSGAVMGQALQSLGVNMLLGPSVDLSNPSRAGLSGDLKAGVLGESPFWVGVLAEAYIRGVDAGSEGSVLSMAAHFPGWGASDRDVREEVPILQGSLESHLQTDLLPFVRLVSLNTDNGGRPIDGLLVSHVQFRGVTSATRMTRPVSFDPQGLQYFLTLPEVKAWRDGGGLMISDSLGAASVRRLYDPQMQDFQAKRIAYDAFLAGNDILNLDGMGSDSQDWEGHFANARETLDFFHSKYVSDPAFRNRVDDSVRRILAAKRRLYSRFSTDTVIPPTLGAADWDKGWEALSESANTSVTLVHPRLDEMVARVPSPPSLADKVVIFEDVRLSSPCAGCEPVPQPAPGTTFTLLQQLYGQEGSGHLNMAGVQSYTFADLWHYLQGGLEPDASAVMEQALSEANWMIFLTQDSGSGSAGESAALSELLRSKVSLVQGKRIVVIACGAPYYIDSTDIAKISALYAVYSTSRAAIESGLRAFFREFAPTGISPVSIPGVQYSIAEHLLPSAEQLLYVEPLGNAPASPAGSVSIGLGDELTLTTGPITDWNGNMVPDGTAVTFMFSYPSDKIAWQQDAATKDGKAQTVLRLDTAGTLEVAVMSGEARQTAKLLVAIQENSPAIISTIVPTPSATAQPIPTPNPVFPGNSEPVSETGGGPLDIYAFFLTLSGLVGICASIAALGYQRRLGWVALQIALFSFCGGMLGYLTYGLFARLLENAEWFAGLASVLSWRWQSAGLAWVMAVAVGLVGCKWPLFVQRAARFLSRVGGGEGSDSKRQQQ